MGGMARHWMTGFVTGRVAAGFPWGTFIVNVLGALLIGTVLAVPEGRLGQGWREFLAIGMLGGFTTFSAFSFQTVLMIHSGKIGLALAYVIGSVVLCLLACAFGWWIGSHILR